MVDKLLNIMRMQSLSVNGNTAHTRLATVSSYDPNNYTVKVLYQPDNTESGWLPIGSAWVGNGWGMFSPPPIGTMVKVHFQEGNHEAGIVDTSHFNDGARPLPTPAGEMWIVHGSGSSIKIQNDGTVNVVSNQNTTITVGGTTTITSTGDVNVTAPNLNVTGNITATGNITDGKDSMENIRTLYNEHTHDGGPLPSPQMPT